MFNIGDKVRCVSGRGALKVGKIYTIKWPGEYINVEEVDGGWYPDRFVLYEAAPVAAPTARANDPATSKGKRKVNKYEQAVLAALHLDNRPKPESWKGLTGKDIATMSGHPLNCITPRFAPLRRKGLIKDSGVKRDKQIVWVLA